MAEKTIIVHLVWAPLGAEAPAGFVKSYLERPAGREHELVVVFNGAESPEQLAELQAVFAPLEHRALVTPESMLDLDAYRWASEQLHSDPEPTIVFCGANTRWLTDDWLQKIVAAFDDPEIGMVSGGGSYESLLDSLSFGGRLRYGRRFPSAPNPHLRTNVFAFSPAALSKLSWARAGDKIGAWTLENGRRSFYRQVVEAGFRGVVVGADGSCFEEADWATSNTWRSRSQDNLIAGDLRSEEYQSADPDERAHLRRLSWGES